MCLHVCTMMITPSFRDDWCDDVQAGESASYCTVMYNAVLSPAQGAIHRHAVFHRHQRPARVGACFLVDAVPHSHTEHLPERHEERRELTSMPTK